MNPEKLKMILIQQTALENDINILITINRYKNKRRLLILKLLLLEKKKKIILKAIQERNRPKMMWTKKRTSTFWEKEVVENDEEYFKQHFRMSRRTFDLLCLELKNLEKQDTNYRKCIPLNKRIAIAVYALGSSAEYRTISVVFGVGISTVCEIVRTFCQEVWNTLQSKYLCFYPLTEQKIKENVSGFDKLGFPQCFGAIDGCHIEVQPSAQDSVDYYNYKGWYSSVLLAVVDYRYRFLYISVGSPGRCNDSQIYESSYVKQQHQSPILKEMSKQLCGVDVPVVLIGDSAFRFSDTLMKPYPFSTSASFEERNFNYALSKCRRVVENCFGHLKARFRKIGKGLDNHIDNTSLIIKACCVLHNFLNENNDHINNQWLQNSNNNSEREQPEHSTYIGDFDSTATNIRNAISRHLARGLDVEELSIEEAGTLEGVSASFGWEDNQFSFVNVNEEDGDEYEYISENEYRYID